jgi:hypothetical protein
VGAEIGSIGLDNLARDGRRVRYCKHVEEAQIGLREADAQRVAIEHLESGNRRVIVEFPRLGRPRAHLVRANDLALDQPQPRTFHGGIEQALQSVRLIGGGELARLALERWIRREENSGFSLKT